MDAPGEMAQTPQGWALDPGLSRPRLRPGSGGWGAKPGQPGPFSRLQGPGGSPTRAHMGKHAGEHARTRAHPHTHSRPSERLTAALQATHRLAQAFSHILAEERGQSWWPGTT